jgi:hypothetical protein
MFLFAVSADRDAGLFHFNRTAYPLCCKFYDTTSVLPKPVLSSLLLMRYITSPPTPHQRCSHDDSYCGHLIVGWLGIFCSTPDLTITKQKKNLFFFSEVLVIILQVWRCMGTFLRMICFIYWLLSSRIGGGFHYVRSGANEILVTKVQSLTHEKAMCVRSQVSCPKQLHGWIFQFVGLLTSCRLVNSYRRFEGT